MAQQLIQQKQPLAELCDKLRAAKYIAFDTEFVSEHTYRPQLCLVQVAWAGEDRQQELVAIDPLECDVSPFWEAITAPGHTTIVHAGREEFIFCHHATGQRPTSLFDVQVAAGMIGFEYPVGYGNLVQRLINQRPKKGETRTDWRRRPLSKHQLEYALDDVRYLLPVYDQLQLQLSRENRVAWLDEEMASWQDSMEHALEQSTWRRVSGISRLSRRELAIVRELWQWREEEASERDKPRKSILRDDMIVELAKRKAADPQRIRALRGFERRHLSRAVPALAERIGKALNLADSDCPRQLQRETNSHLTALGQFMGSALSSVCRGAQVAPSLVGTQDDIRELAAYRLAGSPADAPVPSLMQGWRAEVVGRVLDDILAGKTAVRVIEPLSEHPLGFETWPPK